MQKTQKAYGIASFLGCVSWLESFRTRARVLCLSQWMSFGRAPVAAATMMNRGVSTSLWILAVESRSQSAHSGHVQDIINNHNLS